MPAVFFFKRTHFRFSASAGFIFAAALFVLHSAPGGCLYAFENRPIPADNSSADLSFWSEMDNGELAAEITARMTDEELFGQILMFGWAGKEPETLLFDWIRRRYMGNAKVFGWGTDNTQDVARSVAAVQKAAQETRFKIPLFIATDQEGGWIRHIKGGTSETPGNLAAGAADSAADAYYSGYYIGRELFAMGVNMNFAPTVDLFTNPQSSIIGSRSFGDNPLLTGILGTAFAAGSMDAGVIPTAKHFPGHGDTKDDSHGVLPEIRIDSETLANRELVPFKCLLEANIPAIMSGHLSFPLILGSNTPASLSKTFLQDILRNQLGYSGLIITDDMMMNGATIYAGGFSIAVCLAVEAGNDIIISSTTPRFGDVVWKYALDKMRTSEAFKNRVKDAARRVITAKLEYFKGGKSAPLYPDPESIPARIPDPEGKAFFLNMACRSITPFKWDGKAFPAEQTKKVLLAGQYASFFSAGKKRYADADIYQYNTDSSRGNILHHGEILKNRVSSYDAIIFCVADEVSADIADIVCTYAESERADSPSGTGRNTARTAVVSIMSPFPALKITNADAVLLAYSYSPYSFTAAFGALCGDFEPKGEIPVEY